MILLVFAENSIQLVPDGTLFLHIAIILMMVYVLNSTLFKPINRILEEREKRTRGRSGEASEIMRSVDEGLSKYERTLREARAEGYRLMEEERSAAMIARQNKLNAVREEVKITLDQQKRELGAQADLARSTLAVDSRRLAAEIGAQILRRRVSDQTVSSVN
jgi:F-type H+-transporting ATPase subunit b